MLSLAGCDWIRRHLNVIITGPTGTCKSYLACALAHKACLEGLTARQCRGCWKSWPLRGLTVGI